MDENENGEHVVIRREAYIHVLNRELEEVMLVDMAEAATKLGYDDKEWMGQSYTQLLRYMGDDIYWCMKPQDTTDSEWYVFRGKREDFIAGEPEFEYVYQYNGY